MSPAATARSTEQTLQEIERIKGETHSSLDRCIAAASETHQVAGETEAKLLEQGDQLHRMQVDLDVANKTLDNTNKKLKYGFGWKGFITGGKAKAAVEPAAPRPVSRVRRQVPTRAGAPSSGSQVAETAGPEATFDSKLDAIDKLLEGLGGAAERMKSELQAQGQDMDAVQEGLDNANTKATKQSHTMKRRFGLK